jgi:branched-subunit amino acid ABC-type transport system permease component
MAVGAFILGLGYAMVFGGPNIANIVYGANSVGSSAVISVSDAFSTSFWFVWMGIVLFPVGLAILAYGVGAQRSSPETSSTEPASTETGI